MSTLVPRLLHVINDTALRHQILRFVVTGFAGLFTDVLTYRSCVHLGVHVTPAKALGCIAGTVLVFFINRAWTFSSQRRSLGQFLRFSALYTTSITLNTFLNTTLLGIVPEPWLVAFFVATSVSTIINFLGLKFFVFADPRLELDERTAAELAP